MLDKNIIVYLDDILIFTKNEAEHRWVLSEVLYCLAHYLLYVKENKYALFLKQVDLFGHIATSDGICVLPGKISAVKDWPQPRTMIELQQFLGLYNYYHHFIKIYARIAAPLMDLLRGKPSFIQFNGPQVWAFQELKRSLTPAPVRKIYDPDLPTIVHYDASKLAIAAIQNSNMVRTSTQQSIFQNNKILLRVGIVRQKGKYQDIVQPCSTGVSILLGNSLIY